MSETYTDRDIYVIDLEAMQHKIRLKPMPRQRKESRLSLLYGFTINLVLWALLLMGGRWLWELFR